jgi:hypothetical protein
VVKCCVILLLSTCSAVSAAGIRKVSLERTSPRLQLNSVYEDGSVHLINYLDAQVNMHADQAFHEVHRVAGRAACCCPRSPLSTCMKHPSSAE